MEFITASGENYTIAKQNLIKEFSIFTGCPINMISITIKERNIENWPNLSKFLDFILPIEYILEGNINDKHFSYDICSYRGHGWDAKCYMLVRNPTYNIPRATSE